MLRRFHHHHHHSDLIQRFDYCTCHPFIHSILFQMLKKFWVSLQVMMKIENQNLCWLFNKFFFHWKIKETKNKLNKHNQFFSSIFTGFILIFRLFVWILKLIFFSHWIRGRVIFFFHSELLIKIQVPYTDTQTRTHRHILIYYVCVVLVFFFC